MAGEAQHAQGVDVGAVVDGDGQIMLCEAMKQGYRHRESMRAHTGGSPVGAQFQVRNQ